jgi:hypothetical protein
MVVCSRSFIQVRLQQKDARRTDPARFRTFPACSLNLSANFSATDRVCSSQREAPPQERGGASKNPFGEVRGGTGTIRRTLCLGAWGCHPESAPDEILTRRLNLVSAKSRYLLCAKQKAPKTGASSQEVEDTARHSIPAATHFIAPLSLSGERPARIDVPRGPAPRWLDAILGLTSRGVMYRLATNKTDVPTWCSRKSGPAPVWLSAARAGPNQARSNPKSRAMAT